MYFIIHTTESMAVPWMLWVNPNHISKLPGGEKPLPARGRERRWALGLLRAAWETQG